MGDKSYDEGRPQHEPSHNEGRTRFDEGLVEARRRLDRLETRHALLVGVLLLLGTVLTEFPDVWIGSVLERIGKPADAQEPHLQVLGARSAAGFSFTNRDSRALSNCTATVRDGMGVEWQAPVGERLESNQTVRLAWSDFVHGGQSLEADAGRPRPVVVSCFAERLHTRQTATLR